MEYYENEEIDILTEECIKKIVDEIGCTDFVSIMTTDEDYGYDVVVDDFEIEALNSPLYKQAKEVYEEYKLFEYYEISTAFSFQLSDIAFACSREAADTETSNIVLLCSIILQVTINPPSSSGVNSDIIDISSSIS